jgi:hypothetical protein
MTMIEIDNLTHDYVTGILQRRSAGARRKSALSVQRGRSLVSSTEWSRQDDPLQSPPGVDSSDGRQVVRRGARCPSD